MVLEPNSIAYIDSDKANIYFEGLISYIQSVVAVVSLFSNRATLETMRETYTRYIIAVEKHSCFNFHTLCGEINCI